MSDTPDSPHSTTPPPYRPPAGPPGGPAAGPPSGPPTVPNPPLGGGATPPTSPSTPTGQMPTPGYGQPAYGQPAYGQPGFGQPGWAGATPGFGTPVTPNQPSTTPGAKKSKRRLITGVAVLVVIAVVVVVGAVVLRGTSKATISVSSCAISADGQLSAHGKVKGPNGTGVTVSVEFVDTQTDKVVATATEGIDLSFGALGNPWEVRGTAGAEVQQVVCRASVSI